MQQTASIKLIHRARRYAADQYRRLRCTEEFNYCHESFAMVRALEMAEEYLKKHGDDGFFGVETSTLTIGKRDPHEEYLSYLNTGDSYGLTICHWRGRFILSSWGDIVERFDRSE